MPWRAGAHIHARLHGRSAAICARCLKRRFEPPHARTHAPPDPQCRVLATLFEGALFARELMLGDLTTQERDEVVQFMAENAPVYGIDPRDVPKDYARSVNDALSARSARMGARVCH